SSPCRLASAMMLPTPTLGSCSSSSATRFFSSSPIELGRSSKLARSRRSSLAEAAPAGTVAANKPRVAKPVAARLRSRVRIGLSFRRSCPPDLRHPDVLRRGARRKQAKLPFRPKRTRTGTPFAPRGGPGLGSGIPPGPAPPGSQRYGIRAVRQRFFVQPHSSADLRHASASVDRRPPQQLESRPRGEEQYGQ